MHYMKSTNNKKIVFFGGPQISVDFFDSIYNAGILPSFVVTTPDKPAGRKLVLTPPSLKVWATERSIQVIQPTSLKKDKVFHELLIGADLFVVVAYGKIIPQEILAIPGFGTINLHPSLLPKYRGASPIQSAILADDKTTGISLMLLDVEMDHGPILAQKEITVQEWKMNRDMEYWFAQEGSKLFLDCIDSILQNTQGYTDQIHKVATFCTKYTKNDMEIDLSKPRESWLKYCTFQKPFFFHQGVRIIVTDAVWEDNDFIVKKIIPEGKKEVRWSDYLKTHQ